MHGYWSNFTQSRHIDGPIIDAMDKISLPIMLSFKAWWHSADKENHISSTIQHPITESRLFPNFSCRKSRAKVIGEVKVESHNMGPTFSWLASRSFDVNRASHSWVTTFSKFDLENQGSRSWVRSQSKVTMCLTSYWLTSLSFHVNRASHSWVTTFP